MKKFKLLLMLIAVLLVLPTVVDAKVGDIDEDGFEVINQTDKYYKTVTIYVNNENSIQGINSEPTVLSTITYEISEFEYENVNINNSSNYIINYQTIIETTYKHMVTTLNTNGNTFRYKNVLTWRIMPSTRSHDIIGIGFYSSVKPLNNVLYFNQEYIKNGVAYNSSLCTKQIFSNGASATFALPGSSDVTDMKQTLYFDVEKTNPNSTITSQGIFGDYAHATSTSTLATAIMHEVVGSLGIVHNLGTASYYDTMNVAAVYWSGTW